MFDVLDITKDIMNDKDIKSRIDIALRFVETSLIMNGLGKKSRHLVENYWWKLLVNDNYVMKDDLMRNALVKFGLLAVSDNNLSDEVKNVGLKFLFKNWLLSFSPEQQNINKQLFTLHQDPYFSSENSKLALIKSDGKLFDHVHHAISELLLEMGEENLPNYIQDIVSDSSFYIKGECNADCMGNSVIYSEYE